MEWKNINEEKPIDGSRVLVCDKYYCRVNILIYNATCECWDSDDSDDYYCDLTNRITYWMYLPDYVD